MDIYIDNSKCKLGYYLERLIYSPVRYTTLLEPINEKSVGILGLLLSPIQTIEGEVLSLQAFL